MFLMDEEVYVDIMHSLAFLLRPIKGCFSIQSLQRTQKKASSLEAKRGALWVGVTSSLFKVSRVSCTTKPQQDISWVLREGVKPWWLMQLSLQIVLSYNDWHWNWPKSNVCTHRKRARIFGMVNTPWPLWIESQVWSLDFIWYHVAWV